MFSPSSCLGAWGYCLEMQAAWYSCCCDKKFLCHNNFYAVAGGAFQRGGSFDDAGWSIEVCVQLTVFFRFCSVFLLSI